MNKIDLCREVISESSAKRLDGILIDLVTARAIVTVYEALNESNKGKYVEMPVDKMARLAFKLTA